LRRSAAFDLTADFAPSDPLKEGAGSGQGGGSIGVIIGAIAGVLAVVGLAIVGFVLWKNRKHETWTADSNSGQKESEFLSWQDDGHAAELPEVDAPLVTQADVATFSDILTYADDDPLGFRRDEIEGAFSLL
jgi:hypothetical protein